MTLKNQKGGVISHTCELFLRPLQLVTVHYQSSVPFVKSDYLTRRISFCLYDLLLLATLVILDLHSGDTIIHQGCRLLSMILRVY